MVDHYRMSQPTFSAHPHAGFCAVTYMFDDAQTGFINRDSLGDHSVIRAGDLHWTTAGAGIVHDEVPQVPGQTAHGLQIFVNLAAATKHMPPGSIHVGRERMPVIRQGGGAQVKVAFGAYDDAEERAPAVVDLPTDAALLDVGFDAGSRFTYPVSAGQTAFLLVITGSVQVDEQELPEGQAVSFARDGGRLEITAVQASRIALFLGRPLGEPVVRHGPFAMTNQADIQAAIEAYQSGRMGRL
jgi:redox-sensitive bicupin YhaK (pirin superfamily)